MSLTPQHLGVTFLRCGGTYSKWRIITVCKQDQNMQAQQQAGKGGNACSLIKRTIRQVHRAVEYNSIRTGIALREGGISTISSEKQSTTVVCPHFAQFSVPRKGGTTTFVQKQSTTSGTAALVHIVQERKRRDFIRFQEFCNVTCTRLIRALCRQVICFFRRTFLQRSNPH